jgi:hypothetical protein
MNRLIQIKGKLRKSIAALFVIASLLTSCKSYYNDTIHWMDSIKPGTSLEDVKNDQPDFVSINWSKPDTVAGELRFRIDKIKGNNDVLAMEHYLIFRDNKFQERTSYK